MSEAQRLGEQIKDWFERCYADARYKFDEGQREYEKRERIRLQEESDRKEYERLRLKFGTPTTGAEG